MLGCIVTCIAGTMLCQLARCKSGRLRAQPKVGLQGCQLRVKCLALEQRGRGRGETPDELGGLVPEALVFGQLRAEVFELVGLIRGGVGRGFGPWECTVGSCGATAAT